MDKEFSGKTVLITGGGGSCVGGPTALRFAQEGANIVICDIHQGRNQQWAEKIRAETAARVLDFHLDIADRAAVDAMLSQTQAELQGVDILVCNAAENKLGHIAEYDIDDWDRTIDVSLTANFYLTRKIIPTMIAKGYGNIVNIASVAAWIGNPNPERGEPAYATSKAALLELTRQIAWELGPKNIRCNAVALGCIWSRFIEKFQDQFEQVKNNTPLRRFGTSEDAVEAILFLASDKRAGFITGESLNVSGGWYMRP